MIGFVMVGTNNLKEACIFYDNILSSIDLVKVYSTDKCVGYAPKNQKNNIEFYITKPVNQKEATYGNGTQISFLVHSRNLVDMFHDKAIKIGVKNEGFPGPRPSNSSSYYCYIRDLDGNKICVYSK
ncbi:VOC family protein [Alphaproteobacteria bacterium]|nr:VOC family protein [Alphaproteobacteria bacterium]